MRTGFSQTPAAGVACRLRAGLAAVLILAAPPAPLPAAEDEGRLDAAFDLSLAGFRVGLLALEGGTGGGRYAVRMTLRTTGLAGLVYPVRYEGGSEGRIAAGRMVPEMHWEHADTGRHLSDARIDFRGPVPVVRVAATAADGDPAAVAIRAEGAVDPVTALAVALEARGGAPPCPGRLEVFDGARLTRAEVAPPEAEPGGIRCAGRYLRVAGFPEDELAERRSFGFTLRYTAGAGGRLVLSGIEMDTLYGRGRLNRR
ncbi:MAG: DUF3108 domain-containing protein [Paracoccaceae bacterium]